MSIFSRAMPAFDQALDCARFGPDRSSAPLDLRTGSIQDGSEETQHQEEVHDWRFS